MQSLIESIRRDIIGENHLIPTPFGARPLVYADYTASGRALASIENFIQQRVLPFYANTHSETSFTGRQTTALREQARQHIRRALNGGPDDLVIFCGSGATAAIHKLIDILNLRLPADLNTRYQFQERIPAHERPVVFIGPYEHHSNELPWRESIAELVVVPFNRSGLLDLDTLEQQLRRHQRRPLLIGSFSAASNVTGLTTDVAAVTRLLHRYGALSCWDYAAAAPYVGIDMTGAVDSAGDSHLDAVFLSPHKLIGGPGTPGVLVMKRQLAKNRVPAVPGGGTVVYVTPRDHHFIEDPERREEGGTPAIVEAIRAGLVFKLRQAVGTDEIERRESEFARRALARWRTHDAIEILGNTEAPRLSIIALQIKWRGKNLHYGFAVALLNDLFGIQARGGCSCAGPYGHALLNMDLDYSKALERELLQGRMILRPGWVRLNFNYFIDEDTFNYILRAVELVARHGWRLLPFYAFDSGTGMWRYQGEKSELAVCLDDIAFGGTASTLPELPVRTLPLKHYLEQAEAEISQTPRRGKTYAVELPPSSEALRWFALPRDAATLPA